MFSLTHSCHCLSNPVYCSSQEKGKERKKKKGGEKEKAKQSRLLTNSNTKFFFLSVLVTAASFLHFIETILRENSRLLADRRFKSTFWCEESYPAFRPTSFHPVDTFIFCKRRFVLHLFILIRMLVMPVVVRMKKLHVLTTNMSTIYSWVTNAWNYNKWYITLV